MSEHGPSDSHETASGNSPLVSAVGYASLIAVPALMILTLGVTGFEFLRGVDWSSNEEAAETASIGSDTAGSAPGAPAPGSPETPGATAGLDPELMELGKKTYGTCMACHGADGKGMKTGPMLMAPSLAGSEMLLGDPARPTLAILKGIAKETTDYLGVMAALGATLDDKQVAAVLTYTRNSFGNTAPAVTAEEVAAMREEYADVPMNLSRSKIDEVVGAQP